MRSDASARFERGVDPYGIDASVARFVELLGETCPDLTVHAGAVDARAESLPAAERRCDVRVSQANRIIGVDLDAATVIELLAPIGFSATERDDDVLDVALPSWRPDSTTEIDVIEEIARRYGYENVAKRIPLSPNPGGLSVAQQRRRQLRQVLLGIGLSEAMPSPFLAAADLRDAGLDDDGVVTISNPLVADENVLRPSLRPGLLRALAFNVSHRRRGVHLFEIGHVYRPSDSELPDEREWLTVVLAGSEAPAAVEVWREIAAALGTGARLDQQNVPAGLHASRSASLLGGRDVIGAVGEVAAEVLERYGIDERVAIVEVELTNLLASEPKPSRWKPTSRHPSSDLDIALVVPESVPADRVEKAIRQSAGPLLVDIELFDVYRGETMPADTRSLAYRLRLQAADRNLSDADVATALAAVTKGVGKLGATIRGG